MESLSLLEELVNTTIKNRDEAVNFKLLSIEKLKHKTDTKSWSILECIEHLNRYGRFYIPEIRNSINSSKYKSKELFKTGILGNYFAKSMLPKDKLNKMKTFKVMNPNHSKLDISVLNEFIKQQEELIILLKDAKKVSLTKNKTSISISKLIKLRLGDTFKVVIYHNLRHIVQAKKIV